MSKRAGKATESPAFQWYAAEYLADENVTLMTLEEEGAYIRALSYCWREGSIPADLDLLSRLLKTASLETVRIVVQRFRKIETPIGARLVHGRLEKERRKQAEWKRKSASGGKLSGKTRREKKLHAEPNVKGGSQMVEPNANRPLEPNANSSSSSSSSISKEQKQKPSRGKREGANAVKHSSDPRHIACKDHIFAAYRHKNGGADPDWDGREGKALGMLLNANPALTAETIKPLLAHWARSDINHSDRPSIWVPKLSSFRIGPIDRFNKPIQENGNGNNGNLRTSAGKGPGIMEAARSAIRDVAHQAARDSSAGEAGLGRSGDVQAVRDKPVILPPDRPASSH